MANNMELQFRKRYIVQPESYGRLGRRPKLDLGESELVYLARNPGFLEAFFASANKPVPFRK
jgi:hypothetical protein